MGDGECTRWWPRGKRKHGNPRQGTESMEQDEEDSWFFGALQPSSFPPVWKELKDKRQFCDATLQTSDGRTYNVHRVILAAVSGYFRAVFTSELSSTVRRSDCPVKVDYDHDVVEALIEFSYTGKCTVDDSNIEKILPAADQLSFLGLVQACCLFLASRTTVFNCWGVHKFAASYFCRDLAAYARRFVLFNFHAFVAESQEFLEMSATDIVSLLSDDRLNVSQEHHVHRAITKWIRHDEKNRVQHADKLYQCIRFFLVSKDHFKLEILRSSYASRYVSRQLLRASKIVVGLGSARRSSWVRENKYTGQDSALQEMLAFRPRVPHEIIFAIGGWSSGAATNYIETYDIRSDQWFLCLHTDQCTRAYHGAVVVDNLLYVLGGFDGITHFNTVRCFDPVAKLWSQKACMHQARCYVCVVQLDGYIYAMGGYNGRIRMNSVERYSVELNQWELIPPMNRQRSDAGAAVLNGLIYVAGGFSGDEILRSAEVYNPATGIWTEILDMNEPRSGLSLVALSNRVFAMGGFNGFARLNSVERYDPDRADAGWDDSVAGMIIHRSNFASAVLEGRIIVVGGYNGTTTVASAEQYDWNKNEWSRIGNMSLNRSALAVCVSYGLPNAAEYSYNSRLQDPDKTATGDSV